MIGGHKRESSARKLRRLRLNNQGKFLNSLRLAYFLSPQKLQSQGLKNVNVNYIYRILELLYGYPKNERVLAISKPGTSSFFLEDHINIQNSLLKRLYYKTSKNKSINRLLTLGIPSFIPKNTLLVFGKKNIKAIPNFVDFIERVIIFQQFELIKELPNPKFDKPQDYSDFLKKSLLRSPYVSEKIYNRTFAKVKKIGQSMTKEPGQITDKDIAKAIYSEITPKTLQLVRQTRKRLKSYNLL